jgi:hypothetical protein
MGNSIALFLLLIELLEPLEPELISGALGVTLFEVADTVDVPTELMATIVKVYAVLFVSPVTIIGEVNPEAVIPPGKEVTRYEVIVAPPFELGGEKETLT